MAGKKGTLTVRVISDTKPLEKGLDEGLGKAEKKMTVFAGKAGDVLKTGMAGAGVGAGAALTQAFFTGLDQKATTARLAASLDLPPSEAERLGKTTGKLYTAGFGESFEDVSGAVESVMSTLGKELDPDELEPMTEKALNLATVFELDVADAVTTVGFLVRNKLVRDATHGFDLITTALQKVPAAMRGEVLEAINEYGANFAALGFDGEEAIELILTAAQNTSVGVDKVGDAVKEFLIRSTDGSTATSDALKALELDAGAIATAIAGGGPAAEEAFGRVVAALQTVEDPAARAQLAVALFGTPIEDLSVNKIPEFLTALQGGTTELGNVGGAADDLGTTMDTNATKVEAFKRTMQQALVDFVAETVIPSLQDLDENWGLTMELLGTYTEGAAGEVVKWLGVMRDGFSGPIDGALDLLDLLGKIGGHKALATVADALGVDRSEYELLTPEQFAAKQRTASGGALSDSSVSARERRAKPRRHGGPVKAGDPYLVGEEGRELFVPGASGAIVPNGRTEGLLTTPGTVNYNTNTINVNGSNHDERSIAAHLAWMLA